MTHAASPTGFTARERTCPSCGTTATTPFERCRACGTRFDAPPPQAGRGLRRAVVAVAALALVVRAVGIVIALQSKAARQERERARTATLAARERIRLIRVQAPHRGGAPRLRPPAGASRAQLLAARRALVVAVQDAITRDARRRVAAGELEGPIRRTECGPILRAPDAVPDDRRLDHPVGRFDCLAQRRSVVAATGKQVASFGYPFVTALDFERFTWTFCRNTPPPGEGGVALARVRLDRACLAATGRTLGTGYVDEDER